MKKYESLFSVLLAITLAFSLFGCGVTKPKVAKKVRAKVGVADMNIERAGFEIEFKADATNVSKEDIETVLMAFRRRLDDQGLVEVSLKLVGDSRIRVFSPEDYVDPNELALFLGKPAVLKFCDADGNVVLTGNDIEEARSEYAQLEQNGSSQYYVSVKLKPEAVAKFTEATKAAANRPEGENYIGIYLDDVLLSNPRVGAEYASIGIETDTVTITIGEYSGELGATAADNAKNLAHLINSGNLPFEMKFIVINKIDFADFSNEEE